MKKLTLLVFLLICNIIFSQIKFENGYIITNSKEKKSVLIKNADWVNNPNEFEYKLSDNDNVMIGNINEIMEFEVANQKFIRTTVDIDQSPVSLNKLSNKNQPEFLKQTVYLKYLIEGNASLLSYEQNNTKKYFYNLNNGEIKQLIYKMYFVDNTRVAYNTDFKKQLSKNLECGVTAQDIERLSYKKKDLLKVISSYNKCSNSSLSDTEVNYDNDADQKGDFNLNIRPGINSSFYNYVDNNLQSRTTKFDNEITLRVGAELEYVFPVNKNKWSIIFEPTYQYYKSSKTVSFDDPLKKDAIRSIDYKSLELPIGIRHYFFLSDKSKLFANISYVIDLSSKSSNLTFEYNPNVELKTDNNFAIGFGYKYNNKLGIELRYNTPRELLKTYAYTKTKYNSISLIFGYQIF